MVIVDYAAIPFEFRPAGISEHIAAVKSPEPTRQHRRL